jgi:hypothetical protein
MVEVVVDIPEELKKEVEGIPGLELSLVVSRLLKDKLDRMIRFERVLSKSKLSEKKAEEIATKISRSLSKEYDRLHKTAPA